MRRGRKALKRGCQPEKAASFGLSIIELLVVISIVAVLAAMVFAGVESGTRRAKVVQCVSKMRALGQGILLYTQEYGEFPRSLHSAAGAGREPWTRAILPYMGFAESRQAELFENLLRCPASARKAANVCSYGLNVYFELTPDGDDYEGSPQTWRRPVNIARPSRTILLGEMKPVFYADHFMCHLWTSAAGAANAVDTKRHGGRSNFLFVDGHVGTLPLADTFDRARKINLWNPGLAGK